MTSALYNILLSTGLPVAYHHFNTAKTPPYLVYLSSGSENFGADNKVYSKHNRYQIELYTISKDLISEGKVETALDNAGIYYETTEVFIESENLYLVTYFIEI